MEITLEFVQPIRDKNQINLIKKLLKMSNMRDYCLFTLGINSGLRISDMLKLKISDVLTKKHKPRERISLREGKTGKTKDFPLSDTAKKAIIEYLDIRDYELDEPLFKSRKGTGAINRQQAYKIINKVAKEIGIKERIGTHTMRKTFGYHAYNKGIDVSYLQKIFNHSAPSTTLNYLGLTQDDLDSIYLNLNL